jgi:5-methylthioadenosine/S-adenosylhomocysteine deaminase
LYAVTNPASNLKLASGIAPISRYLKEGIPVAIGTDGPASNNCLDMFREMFLVTGLAKYRDQDASSTDALEVLKMATVNGAGAMGLKDCQTLSVGSKADLIMIDLHQPNMQPLHNIPKNLVYAGSKQNVKLTMINGKILYENGNFHIGTEPEEIYKKCNEISKRLLVED